MTDPHIEAAAQALGRNRYSDFPAGMNAHQLDATVAVRAWLDSVGLTGKCVERILRQLTVDGDYPANDEQMVFDWVQAIRAVQS